MEIFLITPPNEQNNFWEETIKLTTPTASTISISANNWFSEMQASNNIDSKIVIIINMKSLLKEPGFIDYMKLHNISVICIDEDFHKLEPEEIMGMGIKALANKHVSVERIGELIRIVNNGGVYIETTK
ncbi:hypothetical protein [Viridibacillus arvi]|uniref:hypothetical protein n=1 Tax=Viridibacillus arvi TaxID=263475 RepID=UPI003D277203